MPRTLIQGGTSRLGQVLAYAFKARGDETVVRGRMGPELSQPFNYAVFCQRYRGEQFGGEFDASVDLTRRLLDGMRWGKGDCSAVIVSSDCVDRISATKNLDYLLGKAAARYLVPWFARHGRVRINAVSPASFTGDSVVVDMQEVVEVITFLCSPASRGINGENIIVDRGKRWK
ncbi:MAG TPA: hypothetical protein VFU31_24930 [Candidatus Binatia bacterium]|nr:hypothetical protein [Candidatus Binatia bacterium]